MTTELTNKLTLKEFVYNPNMDLNLNFWLFDVTDTQKTWRDLDVLYVSDLKIPIEEKYLNYHIVSMAVDFYTRKLVIEIRKEEAK